MDPAALSALAAVMGSIAGGSATVATAWITQRTTTRRERARVEVRKREQLYGDFIGECSRLAADSLTRTLERPETLMPALALLYRIRLAASEPVRLAAERTVEQISEQYFGPNLSLDELRSRSRDTNPLARFADACRRELKALRDG
jgi:hypothetical protein